MALSSAEGMASDLVLELQKVLEDRDRLSTNASRLMDVTLEVRCGGGNVKWMRVDILGCPLRRSPPLDREVG